MKRAKTWSVSSKPGLEETHLRKWSEVRPASGERFRVWWMMVGVKVMCVNERSRFWVNGIVWSSGLCLVSSVERD